MARRKGSLILTVPSIPRKHDQLVIERDCGRDVVVA